MKRIAIFIVPLAVSLGLSASGMFIQPAKAQDEAEQGRLTYNRLCRTCHSWKEGDNRLGPTLYAVIGRKAGTVPGYNFSEAMKQSGVIWDEATLDKFMANPDQVVMGNNMKPFGGVKDEADRKLIIAFLKKQGGK